MASSLIIPIIFVTSSKNKNVTFMGLRTRTIKFIKTLSPGHIHYDNKQQALLVCIGTDSPSLDYLPTVIEELMTWLSNPDDTNSLQTSLEIDQGLFIEATTNKNLEFVLPDDATYRFESIESYFVKYHEIISAYMSNIEKVFPWKIEVIEESPAPASISIDEDGIVQVETLNDALLYCAEKIREDIEAHHNAVNV